MRVPPGARCCVSLSKGSLLRFAAEAELIRLTSQSRNLIVAIEIPLARTCLWSVFERVHQQVTQAVTALQIGVDEFESDFVDTGTAQKHLAADMSHADLNVYIGIRSNAQGVFFCAHATAEAEFAHGQQ